MSLKYFFKILLFSGFFSIFNSCQLAQEKSTSFILIRHAEKIISSSDNPDLSSKGRQRAAKLVDLFEAVSIDAIYATPYLRTINTAEPLAKAKHLEVLNYQANDLQDFAAKLLENHQGETIVVIGHSNTTPQLTNALAGTKYSDLEETEYDWLYFVEVNTLRSAKVKKLKIRLSQNLKKITQEYHNQNRLREN